MIFTSRRSWSALVYAQSDADPDGVWCWGDASRFSKHFAPENGGPLEKEITIEKHNFVGSMLNFGGVHIGIDLWWSVTKLYNIYTVFVSHVKVLMTQGGCCSRGSYAAQQEPWIHFIDDDLTVLLALFGPLLYELNPVNLFF